MRKTSFGTEAAKSNHRPPRLFLGGLALVLLASAGVGACSSTPECDPEIKSGTTFKVTVIKETDKSDRCHVIKVSEFSPFMVSAAKTQPTVDHPDCSVIPEDKPPAVMILPLSTKRPWRTRCTFGKAFAKSSWNW